MARNWRLASVSLSWILLAVLLTSCGGKAVYGHEEVLIGQVHLNCGKECKVHGSCGVSQETKNEVVLLGAEPAFPVTGSVLFVGMEAGSAVDILDTIVVAGVEQRSKEAVEIRFYLVEDPGGESGGWVPGFCIASQPK
jgi:hypothetical protein